MRVSCLVVTQESRWDYFERACRCFLRQTWPDKELVVAADGTPAYLDRLASFCRDFPVPTATALTEAPTPLGELRNLSVRAASGELICQWDDDDQYHPRRVEVQALSLAEAGADLCLLSDYWHYFADTGELYWVDCRFNAAGHPWTEPHQQGFPGSLLARRATMLPYTPDRRGEDGRLLLFATIKRQKFTTVRGAGWSYLYAYHGSNTWERQHHQGYAHQRAQVLTAPAVAALMAEARTRFDPTLEMPAVLAEYEFGGRQPALCFSKAA